MHKANISYFKNHLSQIVSMVKEGESVTLLDRKRPVAVLQPLGFERENSRSSWLEQLVASGVAKAPATTLDMKAFSRQPWPGWSQGATLSELVSRDREDRV